MTDQFDLTSDDLPASIGAGLDRGLRELRAAGIPTPEAEVRLLLGHILNLPHLTVGLDRDRPLSPPAARVFLDLLAERSERRPLQHLLGEVDFYGRLFRVTPGVLIPRPETESVAEVALRGLPAGQPLRIAEVGCGAGILAVTIACERPEAEIWCSDTEPRALCLTALNAATHAVDDRVHTHGGDLLAPLKPFAPFQLVISNPPYVPSAEIEGLAPEVRDHDPRAALDGGADGLRVVSRLLEGAAAVLVPGGNIILELGYDQGAAAAAIARRQGWLDVEILPDLAGRDRVLRASSGG